MAINRREVLEYCPGSYRVKIKKRVYNGIKKV